MKKLHDTAPPPAEPKGHYRGYFNTVGLALDYLANAAIGGRFETISRRCGRAMEITRMTGGRNWPWPRWWVKHCYWAADQTLPS